ncbi:23S rRNA (uracil-5-)-methyltransferase RumB, partial [Yersinia pestis PY-25]
MSVVG